MHKAITLTLPLIAAMTLAQFSPAQDTPATTSQPAKAAPAKTQTSATKKTSTAGKAAPPVTLKTEKEKESYALGMSIGKRMHDQGIPIDAAVAARGLRDSLSGGKL